MSSSLAHATLTSGSFVVWTTPDQLAKDARALGAQVIVSTYNEPLITSEWGSRRVSVGAGSWIADGGVLSASHRGHNVVALIEREDLTHAADDVVFNAARLDERAAFTRNVGE